jgi:cytidylate kinase
LNKEECPIIIAIDGPAGSGKGTVAKQLATKLNYHYLDSGAIYRVIAYAAKKNNIKPESVHELIDLVKRSIIKFSKDVVWLNNKDVSSFIRTELVGKLASQIAIHEKLRSSILDYQRSFCRLPGLIAEGRDMTSIVFPNADLKIYLNASVNERAKRRYKQLISKGNDVNLVNLAHEISIRDSRDKDREVSPLVVVKEAHVLETDNLSEDQTVEKILSFFDEATKSADNPKIIGLN